jgi:hypothetical protein
LAESLTAYIASTGDLPFVWGQRDCTLWVADWCLRRFGFDPAKAQRGRYASEAEADALIGGDLAAFVAPHLSAMLKTKSRAICGDVAVIRALGHDIAAIRQGRFWVVKTETGLAHLRAPAIRIWGS